MEVAWIYKTWVAINIAGSIVAANYVTVRNRLRECPVDLTEHEVAVVDEYEEEYEIRGITTAMTIPQQMKKYLEIMRVPEEQWSEYMRIGLETIGLVETNEDEDERQSEHSNDPNTERTIEAIP